MEGLREQVPLVTKCGGGTSGISTHLPSSVSTGSPVKRPSFKVELKHILYHNLAIYGLKSQSSGFFFLKKQYKIIFSSSALLSGC